jgi:hypothetical protein
MKCKMCGHPAAADEQARPEMDEDQELALKDDILKELMDLMGGSLGDKLKSKKPKAISLEVEALGSSADEEEEA